MFRKKLLGNTHIPHLKSTAAIPPAPMTPPTEVLLPLSQHIGAPANPIVAVGDEVKIGQKIAEGMGYVSSPIYASISGKVKKIEDYLRPDGRIVGAIRIEGDGNMSVYENIDAPSITDLDSLILAARESGLVGLGGAGFPLSVKLDALKKGTIDTVVINGAECEPYITCDTQTMLYDCDLIAFGLSLIQKYATSVKKYIIGIEKNKPECIEKMKSIFSSDDLTEVKALPEKYPQGAEKILIYNTTYRTVPEGKLPADVGVLVINVTTLALLAKYIKTGMPLVARTVTVDGSAVVSPKNVIVPLGTPIRELLDFCGAENLGKVLYGGPMMGIPAASTDEPTLKTTGGITALSKSDSLLKAPSACIHCGRCVEACPLYLEPDVFSRAFDFDNRDERMAILDKHKVMLCMECGCCSFVCPANRPLVQNNRIAKAQLRDYKMQIEKSKDKGEK